MKRIALAIALAAAAAAASAADKTYQVTGPVVDLRDDAIVVQKGKEKWEIARDKDTKVTGDLKAGSKVTIQYQMKATSVEVKADARNKK